MLDFLQIIVLALVQGITEFLPISSSAHLILVPVLTDWPDQGQAMDVAVHLGTLLAVLIYFYRDSLGLVAAVPSLFTGRSRIIGGLDYRLLLIALIIGTIPVVIIGFVLVLTGWDDLLRNPVVIGLASIVFGLLLYRVDTTRPENRLVTDLGFKDALRIGLAQVLALIPGTSRSGITMTMGRQLGFKRTEAARFSMLLSIPTISASGVIAVYNLISDGNGAAISDALLAGGLSFVAAMLAIHFLMKWLTHASMTIFVVYRVALGLALLIWVIAV